MKNSVEKLLQFEINDQGRGGLLIFGFGRFGRLFKKKTFVQSLEEFEEALPELPDLAQEDPRYLHQLAYGLAVVTFGGEGLIQREEDIEGLYLDKGDDPEVLTKARWRTNTFVQGPDPELLGAPKWEENKLVITTVSELSGMQGAFSSNRYEYSFDGDEWSYQRSNIAEVSLCAEQADAAVKQAFGGDVKGFIRIHFDPALRFSAGGDALLAAMSPAEGAARFVWLGSDGEVLRYLTWTDFQVESGAFETSETLAFLISSLYMELTRVRVTHDNYRIIEDPAAYREEYIRSNRQIRKLRYHVDQMQVTEFDVEDFDAIEAPVLQGTEVVAYFENGSGQPNRLAFDLHELGWNMELAMVPLYTERVTSDTGGLLDMPRAVESPAEDDEIL